MAMAGITTWFALNYGMPIKNFMNDDGTGQNTSLALLEEGLFKLSIKNSKNITGNGEGSEDRLPDRTLSLLVKYIEEIELFNGAYGLVKVQDRRELIVKHILDSLAPINILCRVLNSKRRSADAGLQAPAVWQIADIGSGAGLPGIPLAICLPGADFTLIERMGRRAGFLRNTLAILGLSNVQVEEAEMEKLALSPAGAGRFDLVVFRAFRPLEANILKGLLNLMAPGGIIAAYKGRRESVEEEMAGILKAAEKGKGPAIGNWEILPLEVPFLEEERHLVLIKALQRA
jgi:16S rRNA (guanine527-N7)-methyltransferase